MNKSKSAARAKVCAAHEQEPTRGLLKTTARKGAETNTTVGTTKLAAMQAMLRQPGGASISDLMTKTGWQSHSVRGAIAGALKRRMGLEIVSVRVDGERFYRIAE